MVLDLHPARDGAPPAGERPASRGVRARLARLDLKFSPYLFISPFYLVFLLFGAFPLGYTFWVSLHSWGLASGERRWTGLENYRYLAGDADFWHAVVNTVGIFAVSTVPQLLLALVVANALNRKLRGATLLRIGMVAPLVTSTAAVAIVFTQLFDRDFGMVNWLFGAHVDWQAGRGWSWLAISAMVDWRWTGYNALIYLAAMQAIPRDLYEAAAIDGASRARQFWQITVPLLRPTILFTVVVSTIGGLQLFTEPVLFGSGSADRMDGGALHQFQTITMYMFGNAFGDDRYGYGAAVAWALFLLIIVFSLVNFAFVRRAGGTR
ncbi:carbohydrate ABC transporter permease [Actinomadura macrotermitis]|uniref:Lactose transport system permease protein LacF n=1 Tax=Actinomadura macrotermitis TaxID=2585200 RepID=A0A7K0C3L6_9ACTN|nr:sugar ABC transporter permease [Actinomadura macrotermitis]MQY08035.1 Lactose transport system permease protein LacF [Actinomadura macrotermitis]